MVPRSLWKPARFVLDKSEQAAPAGYRQQARMDRGRRIGQERERDSSPRAIRIWRRIAAVRPIRSRRWIGRGRNPIRGSVLGLGGGIGVLLVAQNTGIAGRSRCRIEILSGLVQGRGELVQELRTFSLSAGGLCLRHDRRGWRYIGRPIEPIPYKSLIKSTAKPDF